MAPGIDLPDRYLNLGEYHYESGGGKYNNIINQSVGQT